MALGIVALGPTGTFDPEWDGAVDRPLRAWPPPAVQRPGVAAGDNRDCAPAGLARRWRSVVFAAHLLLLQAWPGAGHRAGQLASCVRC